MKKILYSLGFTLLILVGVLYISDYSYLLRAVSKIYFTGHSTAFLSDYTRFDNHILPASENPQAWPLHKNYNEVNLSEDLEAFHKKTQTVAFVLIKNDSVYLEKYYDNYGSDSKSNSFSVAKSFVSALVGIAHAEGLIGSLDDAMDDYVPLLKETAYSGIRIKDVLQMSSGAKWNEDYSDPDSEVFRLSVANSGGSFDEFMQTMVSEREAGTFCRYNSADTQALGLLIAEATNRSLTEYMQEKLFQPLGIEYAAHWITDVHGREMAYAGLLMTAVDFAKLGELYRLQGVWQGKQLVPADYVSASTQATSPHTQPSQPFVGGHAFGPGYGYQWWIPGVEENTFAAIGVYNQFIFVDPDRETVIVKLSANPAYGTSDKEEDNKDNENLAALLAISKHCGS